MAVIYNAINIYNIRLKTVFHNLKLKQPQRAVEDCQRRLVEYSSWVVGETWLISGSEQQRVQRSKLKFNLIFNLYCDLNCSLYYICNFYYLCIV